MLTLGLLTSDHQLKHYQGDRVIKDLCEIQRENNLNSRQLNYKIARQKLNSIRKSSFLLFINKIQVKQ